MKKRYVSEEVKKSRCPQTSDEQNPLKVKFAWKHGHSCCTDKPNSLLFLHLIRGSEVIKEFTVHLHKGLQDVVDKRHNCSKEETEHIKCNILRNNMLGFTLTAVFICKVNLDDK